VGDGQDAVRLKRRFLHLDGFFERKRHGLVDDDMKPVVERKQGGSGVQVVGGHDGNRIDPLMGRESRLFADEIGVGGVDPLRIHHELGAGGTRFFRVGTERAGHPLRLSVHARGLAMHLADERAGSAADHGESEFSFGCAHGKGVAGGG